MMEEDASYEEEDYAAAAVPTWGVGSKPDSLMQEQDNVSSSTTVAGMPVNYGNAQQNFAGMPVDYGNAQQAFAGTAAPANAACNMLAEQSLSNLSQS